LTTKYFKDFQINLVCAVWMRLCAEFLSVSFMHGDMYPAPFIKNYLLMRTILKSQCISCWTCVNPHSCCKSVTEGQCSDMSKLHSIVAHNAKASLCFE